LPASIRNTPFLDKEEKQDGQIKKSTLDRNNSGNPLASRIHVAHTQTPSPINWIEVSVVSAKLRTGPGTDHPSVGLVSLGQQYSVYDVTEDGTWLFVNPEQGLWLAAVQVKAIDLSRSVGQEWKRSDSRRTQDEV
jgi:uncharacterized protein YraI